MAGVLCLAVMVLKLDNVTEKVSSGRDAQFRTPVSILLFFLIWAHAHLE